MQLTVVSGNLISRKIPDISRNLLVLYLDCPSIVSDNNKQCKTLSSRGSRSTKVFLGKALLGKVSCLLFSGHGEQLLTLIINKFVVIV